MYVKTNVIYKIKPNELDDVHFHFMSNQRCSQLNLLSMNAKNINVNFKCNKLANLIINTKIKNYGIS